MLVSAQAPFVDVAITGGLELDGAQTPAALRYVGFVPAQVWGHESLQQWARTLVCDEFARTIWCYLRRGHVP